MQPDLKNKQLPKGWVKDRIGSRVRVNYGKSQSGIRETGGKIPIYGTGGLIEHGKEALCLGDSVLIGRKGTLGNPLYLEHPFWPVDTTYYTSDFDGCTKWFFYLVQTLSLEKLNEATGVPSLSRETFNRLEVPFPPKPEQEKIAEILTTIDQAIEQKAALIAKYRRIKTGLMQDLLTCGIDENGCLRDPSTHKFKPSPLGQIPEGWHVAPLESMKRRDRPYIKTGPFGSALKIRDWVEVGVPVVTIGSLGEGAIIRSELLYIAESKAQALAKYALQPGDLLFSRVADVGRAFVVSPAEAGWIMSSNLMRIFLDPSLAIPVFAYLGLLSERTTRQTRQAVNASGREVANTSILRSLQFAWPSTEEQIRIVKITEAHNADIHTERTRLGKLKRLKTGLMQDLLTGKVSVEPLLAEEVTAR